MKIYGKRGTGEVRNENKEFFEKTSSLRQTKRLVFVWIVGWSDHYQLHILVVVNTQSSILERTDGVDIQIKLGAKIFGQMKIISSGLFEPEL